MKKFLLILLAPLMALGAISSDKEYKLNHYMGKVAEDVKLGTLLKNGGTYSLGQDGVEPLKVAQATYDFATLGGSSAADISLGITIPSKAVIRRSWLDIITQPVGAGASVAIKTEAAGDILAATGVASLTTGRLDGISTGSAALMKKMTADRLVKVTISNHDLSAGKFIVFLEYVVSR